MLKQPCSGTNIRGSMGVDLWQTSDRSTPNRPALAYKVKDVQMHTRLASRHMLRALLAATACFGCPVHFCHADGGACAWDVSIGGVSGHDEAVSTILGSNDFDGPTLYVGGRFTYAEGVIDL